MLIRCQDCHRRGCARCGGSGDVDVPPAEVCATCHDARRLGAASQCRACCEREAEYIRDAATDPDDGEHAADAAYER